MKLIKFYSIPESKVNVTFHRGLNIISAYKVDSSDKKDSRNGVGKSTLLNLIDFCLLSKLNNNILNSNNFKKYTFVLECQGKDNNNYKIKRSISSPNNVFLSRNDGEWEGYEINEDDNNSYCYNYFRKLLFGISLEEKNELTFRTLMNYVKRDEKFGFLKTFYHFTYWEEYLKNSVNLFLIGLDQHLPLKKNSLIKEIDSLSKTIYGLERNLQDKEVPIKAELNSEKAILEKQIKTRQNKLINFRVHKEYEILEAKANELIKKIKLYQNQIFVIDRKLQEYKSSLNIDIKADISDIKDFYESIKIYFPDNLIHDVSEVFLFHQRLIKNRNVYLSEEIKRLENVNLELHREVESLDKEKSSILKMLETHGALSEYIQINQLLDNDKEKLFDITKYLQVYEDIKNYKTEKNKIKEELVKINEESESEISSNINLINNVILLFDEIWGSITSIQKKLIIGIKPHYKERDQPFLFDFTKVREGSPGIERYKIFAYDLSILFHNISINRNFPQFLIHDGIFTGVDDDVEKLSINYIISKAKTMDFQYIITLNTCEYLEGVNYQDYEIISIESKESLMGFDF